MEPIAKNLIDPRTHPLLAGTPPRTIRNWIETGRIRGFRRGKRWLTTSQAIEAFFAACNKGRMPRQKAKAWLSTEVLETRADQAQIEFPGQTPEFWGKLWQHLFPEIFGRGRSRKACNAIHGTSPMRWRLQERARNMLDLEHPKDSNGIPAANRPKSDPAKPC